MPPDSQDEHRFCQKKYKTEEFKREIRYTIKLESSLQAIKHASNVSMIRMS